MCDITLKKLIDSESAIARIKSALANNEDAQRFIMLAKIEMNNNPKLYSCDGIKVLQCLIKAATLGLYVGTGDTYLVPYKTSCTLQLGYMGMIKLMYRAGVKFVQANVVHANDKFEFVEGTENKITHVRAISDRGDIICAYAIAKIRDENIIEIMSKDEIDFIRCKFSRTGDLWNNFYSEMAKKTVIRRLFKKMPQENFSPAAIQAIRTDESADVESNDNEVSNQSKVFVSKSDMVADIL